MANKIGESSFWPTWGSLMYPISANGAETQVIEDGTSREYPVSVDAYPWFFTASDGSLFLTDAYLALNYVTTYIDGTGGYFFIGQYSAYNTLTEETFAQLLGETVTTTDTADFTITSDAYDNIGTGQDISAVSPGASTYILTIGNLTEVV
jgi:hypothetical protein